MDIVKTNEPMTSQACLEAIDGLVNAYPFCRSDLLTTTPYGRPLRSLVIGNGERRVLFSAAYHANEWITATVLLKFAEDLCRAITEDGTIYGIPAESFAKYDTIYLVPMVDPDGVDLVTEAVPRDSEEYRNALALAGNYPQIPFPDGWKANGQGVDLNLQYPAKWLLAREIKFSQGYTRPGPRDYVGRSPLNQPESRAMYDYTIQVDPALVLAYHTQGREIYWTFGGIPVEGARELAQEFARLSGYDASEPPYESSFAGYKDWFIQQFRRPGFTIEAGEGTNPLPLSQFDTIYRDNLGILTTAALGLPQ